MMRSVAQRRTAEKWRIGGQFIFGRYIERSGDMMLPERIGDMDEALDALERKATAEDLREPALPPLGGFSSSGASIR